MKLLDLFKPKKKWQDKYWNEMSTVNKFGHWLVEEIESQDRIDKVDLHNFIVQHMNEYPTKMLPEYQGSSTRREDET